MFIFKYRKIISILFWVDSSIRTKNIWPNQRSRIVGFIFGREFLLNIALLLNKKPCLNKSISLPFPLSFSCASSCSFHKLIHPRSILPFFSTSTLEFIFFSVASGLLLKSHRSLSVDIWISTSTFGLYFLPVDEFVWPSTLSDLAVLLLFSSLLSDINSWWVAMMSVMVGYIPSFTSSWLGVCHYPPE